MQPGEDELQFTHLHHQRNHFLHLVYLLHRAHVYYYEDNMYCVMCSFMTINSHTYYPIALNKHQIA